ncbi:MAG: hypothetical protein QW478_15880 [Candidatus Micrarchaeaceae archaeon]
MEENVNKAEVQVEKSGEINPKGGVGDYYLYQIVFSVVPKDGKPFTRKEINSKLREIETGAQLLAGGYTLIPCKGGYTFEDGKKRVYDEESYILQIAGSDISTRRLREMAAAIITLYRQESVVIVFPDNHTTLVFNTEVEQIKAENEKEYQKLTAKGEKNAL